jgi:hypothetical protein
MTPVSQKPSTLFPSSINLNASMVIAFAKGATPCKPVFVELMIKGVFEITLPHLKGTCLVFQALRISLDGIQYNSLSH